MIVVICYLFWRFLEWFSPESSIDIAQDMPPEFTMGGEHPSKNNMNAFKFLPLDNKK